MDGCRVKEASCRSGTQSWIYEGQESASGRRTEKQQQRREAQDHHKCWLSPACQGYARGGGLVRTPDLSGNRAARPEAGRGGQSWELKHAHPGDLDRSYCPWTLLARRQMARARELSSCLRVPGFGEQDPASGCQMPPASANFVSPVVLGWVQREGRWAAQVYGAGHCEVPGNDAEALWTAVSELQAGSDSEFWTLCFQHFKTYRASSF